MPPSLTKRISSGFFSKNPDTIPDPFTARKPPKAAAKTAPAISTGKRRFLPPSILEGEMACLSDRRIFITWAPHSGQKESPCFSFVPQFSHFIILSSSYLSSQTSKPGHTTSLPLPLLRSLPLPLPTSLPLAMPTLPLPLPVPRKPALPPLPLYHAA